MARRSDGFAARSQPAVFTYGLKIAPVGIAPAFSRLALPSKLLQRVAGVLERHNWAAGETSNDATVPAGQRALADAGVEASEVGLLTNTSVSREHLVEFGERVPVAPRLRDS